MVFPRVVARRLAVGAAACSALLAIGAPSATGDPQTDGQGFVNSTARCTPPNVVVAFGNTDNARVAICRTPNGQFEYRGVRVSDGAKLIAPATQDESGAFIAEDDGNTYAVTSRSLVVRSGEKVISEESMENFHQPGTGGPSRGTTTPPTPGTTSTPNTTPTVTSTVTKTPQEPAPPAGPAEPGGG
jgi:hypothetical protein